MLHCAKCLAYLDLWPYVPLYLTVLEHEESVDSIALQEYIARFSGAVGATLDDGDTGAIDMSLLGPVELGKAPPCEMYASLRPLAELVAGVQKYHSCTQPAHVKDKLQSSFMSLQQLCHFLVTLGLLNMLCGLQDVTGFLNQIRTPAQQLLYATSRAEKFLKGAIAGLKKAKLKEQAELCWRFLDMKGNPM